MGVNLNTAASLTMPGALTGPVSITGSTTFSGSITGFGVLNINAGANTVTLTGNNNNFTGWTTITGGTLSISSDANFGSSSSSSLLINGGTLRHHQL